MKRLPLLAGLVLLTVLLVGALLWVFSSAKADTAPRVLLSDDFESGTDKWTVVTGDWSVDTDGTRVYSQSHTVDAAIAVAGSPNWTDYAIQARVKPVSGTYAMLITRYQDAGNYYFMALRLNNGKIEFKKMVGGSSVGLGSINAGITRGTWYTATFEIVGTTMRGYLNGTLMITVTDNTASPPFATGRVGLGTRDASGEFDDVIVTSIPTYITVTLAGNGSGSVGSMPAAIDCGVTCTAGFERGSAVTLTASPVITSSFATWMGAGCGSASSCVVTIDAAKSITAVFSSSAEPMLIVNKAGNGIGSVTSIPPGIDCGVTCMIGFAQGTLVTLTATTDGLSTFGGWGGACLGPGIVILPSNQCVIPMNVAASVVTTFTYSAYPLTVNKVGNGTGIITSTPEGISCGVTCTADLVGVVVLTATATNGSGFTGWGGAGCSGAGSCVITMTTAQNVTATFSKYYAYLPMVASYIPTVTVAPVYVAPGGNDSNPGTSTQPFKSLTKAVSVVVPGQTIYMRGGTYNYTETVTLSKNGNSVNMFRIWAYPGEWPVLDFSGQPYTNTARGFAISGSFWHLLGLEIKNAGDNGIYIDGSHNIIERCVLHDNRDSGLQIGLGSTSTNPNGTLAAYNQVINCDSYRNVDPPDGSDADGFACKLHAGKGNVFKGCRSWENADDGWDLFDADYAVIIENSWTWHNGDRSLFGNPSVWGGNGNGFKVGGNANHAANILKNCIAFDHVYGTGSDTKGFDQNGNRSGNTVYNSLAFSNTINYSFPIQPDDGTHHILKNNVGFGGVKANNLSSGTDQVANSWNLAVTADAADFRSLDVNQAKAPRQADGSLPNNDFARLVAGSDLIDKGVDVGIPYLGSAPDLGPFECY